MFNNLRAHQGGYPNPTVAAKFAQPANDFTTLLTTTSMPSGGSITRSGQAMLYDSTGKLTYAPNNILTYSQQFDNAAWGKGNASVSADVTLAPDGTTTADKLVENTANSTHQTWQNYSTATPGNYLFSFYAKPAGRNRAWVTISNTTTGGANVTFDFSSGTIATVATNGGDFTNAVATITSAGNGWYRCSISATKGTLNTNAWPYIFLDNGSGVTYTGDGTSGLFIWGAQLEAVTYQTTPATYVATTTAAYYGPRFDYDPSTLAAKGLLIEGTRTNLCIYSQTTSDVNWTVTGGVKTSTNNDDPFGTSTAMLFTASATTNHFIGAGSYSFTSGTVYCSSCFVKAGTASLVQFTFNTSPFGSSQYANFNLSGAGSVTASSGGTGYITQLANGWYRIAFSAPATATAASAAGVISLISSTTDARLPSFASTGTIYATGWQLEIGAFPTSYIPVPTTGSTARAAETFAITGYSNNLINATYIDEQTGVTSTQPYNAGTAPSPSFSWLTSLRAYTNAYAGSISSPSWLSFSRSGNAMMTDSTGKLTFAPSNLLLNTATLSTQTVTTGIIAGCDVILSFKGTGSVAISGGYTGTLAGTGVSTLVSLKFTTTTASLTFTVTGTVTEAQLERVTYETQPSLYVATTGSQYYGPRYDYDASTVPATPRGLLIEESRANVTLQSNVTAANWTGSGASLANTGKLSPDGISNMCLFTEDTATTAHFAYVTTIGNFYAASTTYTASVYLAAGTRRYVVVHAGSTNYGWGVTVDTSVTPFAITGSYTTGVGSVYTSSTVTYVGNGVYRISITGSMTNAATQAYVVVAGSLVSNATAPNTSYTGTSGTFYYWGTQVEAGSFATSYIPTTTASVTRAADVAQMSSAAFSSYINTSVGTLVAQVFDISAPYTSSARVYNLWNSTGSTRTVDVYTVTPSNLYNYKSSNGASTLITASGSAPFRVAVAYQANNYGYVASSGTVTTETSTGTFQSPATLSIGNFQNASSFLNGHMASFAYYNQRLPDAILKQKSAVNAPY